MELRPYQTSAIQSLRAWFASGSKRIILYSPTGSGKTEISMYIIRRAQEKNKKVIFVCNRVELVKQTSRRLDRSGIIHGVIQGGNTCMTW